MGRKCGDLNQKRSCQGTRCPRARNTYRRHLKFNALKALRGELNISLDTENIFLQFIAMSIIMPTKCDLKQN